MEEQIYIFSNLKKFTSPANEFLIHKCRNNRKMQKSKKKIGKIYTSPANEFLLHTVEAIGKHINV